MSIARKRPSTRGLFRRLASIPTTATRATATYMGAAEGGEAFRLGRPGVMIASAIIYQGSDSHAIAGRMADAIDSPVSPVAIEQARALCRLLINNVYPDGGMVADAARKTLSDLG